MSKPKIFYLVTSLNIGGTEKFLVTLAEKLSGEYDITIGVLKSGGALEKYLKDKGFTVINCMPPWRLTGYLRLHQIEIIHTFLFWAHIYGRLAAKFAGTPVVITTQQAVDIWKRFYHTFFDKLTAPLCDYFIANSQAASGRLQKVEKVPEEKIGVVYNGVDFASFNSSDTKENIRKEFNIPANPFVVSCVSRLHHDKGADFLPYIAAKTPGCVFLVAGDGPLMPLLKDKIKSLKLEDRFILCGWRQDTPRILKASDVFILPSREESFPQAALEAMSMKLPVIVADVGGVKELVEDAKNGLLVQPGYIGGFAEAVKKLMNDTALRSNMSEASFSRSQQFSEAKMVKSISSIYQKLLSIIN
jgi:glycosyltransferase involved in cell wall biosynthesis